MTTIKLYTSLILIIFCAARLYCSYLSFVLLVYTVHTYPLCCWTVHTYHLCYSYILFILILCAACIYCSYLSFVLLDCSYLSFVLLVYCSYLSFVLLVYTVHTYPLCYSYILVATTTAEFIAADFELDGISD